MAPVVRRLMKEQHKGMFIALRAGELDGLLEQVCGPHPEPPAPPPATRSAVSGPDSPISSPVAQPVPLAPASSDGAVPSSPVSSDGAPVARPRERSLSNPALRRVTPSVPPQAAEAFDLAVGALEAATAPNAHLARSAEVRRRTPPPIPRASPAHGTHAAGRYAASRPTTIFTNQASPDKQSIFGESVISEQSLDEVILSYLAEDLEAPPHK
jgi:hypothetical protein